MNQTREPLNRDYMTTRLPNLDKIFTEEGVILQGKMDDSSFYKTMTNQSGFEFKDKARKKLTAYEYFGYCSGKIWYCIWSFE